MGSTTTASTLTCPLDSAVAMPKDTENTAATLSDGALARNVVLFAVLVYELVGPTLTKRSLLAVGEIRPEGRTNARKQNDPKEAK